MDPTELCKAASENKTLNAEGKRRKNCIMFHKAGNNKGPNEFEDKI